MHDVLFFFSCSLTFSFFWRFTQTRLLELFHPLYVREVAMARAKTMSRFAEQFAEESVPGKSPSRSFSMTFGSLRLSTIVSFEKELDGLV